MKPIAVLIISFLFAGIFSACTNSKKLTTSATSAVTYITGKKWRLIEIMGQPVADSINGKQPFILFNKEDSSYAANGGCNGLGGKFSFDEKSMHIQFQQGMSTMMACTDMTIEEGLKKVFDATDNYTVNDTVLSLNKARMAPLARFKAAP